MFLSSAFMFLEFGFQWTGVRLDGSLLKRLQREQ